MAPPAIEVPTPMIPSSSEHGIAQLPVEPGLRRLAANLAHNVNNSLAGVIGYLELAQREATAGTHLHQHLEHGLSCAHRIAEMIRRVVAFAFQSRGNSEPEPVSLRQLTEQAIRSAYEPQGEPGYCLTFEAESDGMIRSSPLLLITVLDQLIANALEAMPEGGALAVRVREDGWRCCLSITDTGEGMSTDVLAHVFEPFFTTKHSGHLGVGLALCRDAVEALGGIIQIASVEGRGTTVTLSFPSARLAETVVLPVEERFGSFLPARSNPHAGPHFTCASPLPAAR